MAWRLKTLGAASFSYGPSKLRSHFRRMGLLTYLALEGKPIPRSKLISLLCEHAGDENKTFLELTKSLNKEIKRNNPTSNLLVENKENTSSETLFYLAEKITVDILEFAEKLPLELENFDVKVFLEKADQWLEDYGDKFLFNIPILEEESFSFTKGFVKSGYFDSWVKQKSNDINNLRINFLLQKVKEVQQAKLEKNDKNLLILKLTDVFIQLQNRLEHFLEDCCYEMMSINLSNNNLKKALEIYHNLKNFAKKIGSELDDKNKKLVQQIREGVLEQSSFKETASELISNNQNTVSRSRIDFEQIQKWKKLLPSNIILFAAVTVLAVISILANILKSRPENSTNTQLTLHIAIEPDLAANIVVTGPNGFAQVLNRNQTLKHLEVGEYTITAKTITAKAFDTGQANVINAGQIENQTVLVNDCTKTGVDCEVTGSTLNLNNILKISQLSNRSNPTDFAGSIVTGSQNRVFLEIHDPNIARVQFYEKTGQNTSGNIYTYVRSDTAAPYDLASGSSSSSAKPYTFLDLYPLNEELKWIITYKDGRPAKEVYTPFDAQ